MQITKKYNPIKLKVAQWSLRRSVKKGTNRKVKVCSLDSAQTVGILFAIDDRKTLDKVRSMLKKLQQNNIQTYALGYIPVSKPDDFYLSQKGFNFFSDNDLSFFLAPNNEAAIEFMSAEFDILIDLYSEPYFPTNYIIQKSNAKFKVGCTCESKPFDLMIDVQNNTNADYYFEQVLHYLEMLK